MRNTAVDACLARVVRAKDQHSFGVKYNPKYL